MDELQQIFKQVRELISRYSPPLVAKKDQADYYDLWSVKEVVIAGRKKKEVFFAGVIIQKGYVGFYLMPVYVDEEMKKVFPPEMLALLKGKSCFHIQRIDATVMAQIEKALKVGFDCYRNKGWV
jgi:hypothetical protein